MVSGAIKEKEMKMKKLILGLFVAVFAFSVQAAATNWKFNTVALEDVNGESLAGTITFFLDGTQIGQATIEDYSASADMIVDTGLLKAIVEVTNFSDGAGTFEYTYNISSIPLPGFPDAETSMKELTGLVENAAVVGGTIDLYTSATDNGFTPAGPTPPVVPEPTTGLLVLLGVAGLALRRSRRV